MDDAHKHAEAFEDAVRKAFVKVYGKPKDVGKVTDSILSSFSEKGHKLRWTEPNPDVVLVLTEFAWVEEPYRDDREMQQWGRVIAELRKKGWPAAWDSVNAAVQIVFLERPPASPASRAGSEKPVAKLALDTRAHGQYVCAGCDAELEDAILMTDASVVCPECGTPIEGFEPFHDAIVSASPIKPGDVDMKNWHCCDDECRSRGCSRR
jgi:DNA-directed RNA polymerase subunit RPC12/RpoP